MVNTVSIDFKSQAPKWQKESIILKAQQSTAGIKGRNLYGFSVEKLIGELEENPDLKEARVFRRIPGQLVIELFSHQPPALFMNGKGQLFPVSESGDLMKPLSGGEWIDLPILRGVTFLRDKQKRKDFVQFLNSLSDKGLFSKKTISEVWFEKKDGFHLMLSVANSHLILGQSLGDIQIESVEKVLRYLKQKQLNGRVIDARYKKKVVVRLRNES